MDEFHLARAARDGRYPECRPCASQRRRDHYRKNRAATLAANRAYYFSDLQRSRAQRRQASEKYARARGVKPKRVFASEEERQAARQATKRLYVLRHPERVRAAKRACMERDPARLKAWLTNAKARRKRAQGDVTGREWKAIVFFYGHRCGQCATHADIKPLTVDHFIPLIHGGTNTWRNVWPLCLDCNLRKGTSMPSATAPPHVEPMLRTGTYA